MNRTAIPEGTPGWRLPFGVSSDSGRERTSLREAVYCVTSDVPLSAEEIRREVLEVWGDASNADIGRAIADLVRYGELARVASGLVRIQESEDMEDVE